MKQKIITIVFVFLAFIASLSFFKHIESIDMQKVQNMQESLRLSACAYEILEDKIVGKTDHYTFELSLDYSSGTYTDIIKYNFPSIVALSSIELQELKKIILEEERIKNLKSTVYWQ